MLINFNNKYFTLVAIMFGIYLFYSSPSSRQHGIDATGNLDIPQTAKYVMEIDPKKPESEKTFFEKAVQRYAFSKYSDFDAANKAIVNSTQNTPTDAPLKNGDQVTLKLRKVETVMKEVEPVTIVIGNEMMPKAIEEALIGMKQGEIKLVDNKDNEGNIVKYEIMVISVWPKIELR